VNVFTGDPLAWNVDRTSYAVAVGVFDGVHRGHLAVGRALRAVSDGRDLCALTFGSHPQAVVTGQPSPPLLTTLGRRIELLGDAGFDAVAVIDFDAEVRHLSARDFVDRFLVRGLAATVVAVGAGFKFGYGASGTVDHLRLFGQEFGFEVVETPIVNLHGTEVRSSAIRASVAAGSVRLAARMLGRPFEIEGTVVLGDQRGRTIGFPTANVTMPPGLVRPAGGVYAVRCVVDGAVIDGVSNVGTRPTFGGGAETIEVHLYGIDIDLYDKDVRVQFVDRIRNEQRFTSIDALVSQIEADIVVARGILEA
jgi:riboflavin kinase/FMN adenylyltransferase